MIASRGADSEDEEEDTFEYAVAESSDETAATGTQPKKHPEQCLPPITRATAHREWEVLLALLIPGQILEVFTDGATILRCLLPAGIRPTAFPVSIAVFFLLQGGGRLARLRTRSAGKRGSGCQVISYRLSLRGWLAIRQHRPDLANATPFPSRKKPPTKPAEPTDL